MIHIFKIIYRNTESNSNIDCSLEYSFEKRILYSDFYIYFFQKLNFFFLNVFEEPNRYLDEFNSSFMQSWKATNNYKQWNESPHPAVMELLPGHVCSGHLSMSDVKLKISQISTLVFFCFFFSKFLSWNFLLFIYLLTSFKNVIQNCAEFRKGKEVDDRCGQHQPGCSCNRKSSR